MAMLEVTCIDMGVGLGYYPSGYPYKMVDVAGTYKTRCVKVVGTSACYWCASDSVTATAANCIVGAYCGSVTTISSGSTIPGTTVKCVSRFQDTKGCDDYSFWKINVQEHNKVYTIYNGAMCENEIIAQRLCLGGYYGDGTTCTQCPSSYITGIFKPDGTSMPPPTPSSDEGSAKIDDCKIRLVSSYAYSDDTGTFSVKNSHLCSYEGTVSTPPTPPIPPIPQ